MRSLRLRMFFSLTGGGQSMGQVSPQRSSTQISVAALIVLVSSWLPWGVLSGPLGPVILAGKHLEAIVNAWNSHIRMFGIQFPTSFLILEAIVLVLLAWFRTSGAWIAPKGLQLGIAILGFFQCFQFIRAIRGSGEVLGIGAVLSAAAFAWMVVAILRQPSAESGSLNMN